MVTFSKYAEEKFDILNRHQVFFTREQVSEAVANPDLREKKNRYYFFQKDELRVVAQKTANNWEVITFYPIKD